jgi:hypothetical protein
MNQAFLESTHSYRYEKGISPEEKSSSAFKDHRKRDIFSLGVLIEEVLAAHLSESSKSEDEAGKGVVLAFSFDIATMMSKKNQILKVTFAF